MQYDKVLHFVNFTNLITYDLNGAWNSYIAHQSPLYANKVYDEDRMVEAQLSIDTCMQYIDTFESTIHRKKNYFRYCSIYS